MKENSITVDANDDESILARYRRADAIQYATHLETMVLNAHVLPRWIGESDCFWYKRSSRKNDQSTHNIATHYRLVDAKAGTNTEAFDHEALARALGAAVDQAVDALSLPIGQLEFDLENDRVCFQAFDQRWQWDGTLKQVDTISRHPGHWLVSPDGSKAVFIKDHNLWVRELDSGEERALTQDGEKHYAYATQPESRDLTAEYTSGGEWHPLLPPEAQWSPDSRQLFTLQTDERQVRSLPMVMHAPQDGTIAPRVSERKYPLSGDKHIAQFRLLLIDVAAGTETAVDYSPVMDSFPVWCLFSSKLAWYSGDGCHAYFVDMTRGQKTARVVRVDTQTGLSKALFEESSPTCVELGLNLEQPPMLVALPETNELIWPSERSGWWHLYRYDLNTGELKNAITAGEWLVRDVLHVDKETRELFIQIAGRVEGRNPYYRELARVNMDSGEMNVLASSDHDYPIDKGSNRGVSCTGRFVVTTRARVDETPVTELRDREGEIILTVEAADISGLPQGWQWPEPVSMKADDGITDIYGVVFRPSDFDPNKHYPVLDTGIVMPWYSTLPTGAFLQGGSFIDPNPLGNYVYMTLCAIAELGFIVTMMDGRGTANRSKAFHDFSYGSFADEVGLVDHVAGIKQLAERYPAMDLEKVGIVSPCAFGNAAVFGLLNYPDFFKVGVVWAPWDARLLRQGEVYCGIQDEAAQQQPLWGDVHRLEGKLMVLTGMLDPFFNSSVTFQLVDALVKANKDFDLRLHPNGSHAAWGVKNGVRCVWDYVVRHLQGVEPPKNYKSIASVEVDAPGLAPEMID